MINKLVSILCADLWKSLSVKSPSMLERKVLSLLRKSEKRVINRGYNAGTGEYVDMVEAGVIDPTKVARCALQNAASVSGLMLTTEVMITDIPEETKAAPRRWPRSWRHGWHGWHGWHGRNDVNLLLTRVKIWKNLEGSTLQVFFCARTLLTNFVTKHWNTS